MVHYDPQVHSENSDLFDTESALNFVVEQEFHMENLECRVTAAGVTKTRFVELLVTGKLIFCNSTVTLQLLTS